MVPEDLWGKNLRFILTPSQWDVLRHGHFARVDYKCEICGGVGPVWPVECHEVWKYNDKKYVQILEGLIALCPPCHAVKHAGRTIHKTGSSFTILRQLQKVNEWTFAQAERYIYEQLALGDERGMYLWTQDLTWLEGNPVLKYRPSENANDDYFY